MLADLLRAGVEANGFADEEKEGDRLVLSRRASDQLKPSPVDMVSIDSWAVVRCLETRLWTGSTGYTASMFWRSGMESGFGRAGDRPRPLPLAVTALEGPGGGGEDPPGAEFSFQVKREDEGRLPPPVPAVLLLPLPCFTSLRACAPKLIRRAKEGETGVFIGTFASSSSMTAGSSPKLFLNSGEPVPDEVETLA